MKRSLLILTLASSFCAAAPAIAGKVLVPVYNASPVAGRNQSTFITQLNRYNDVAVEVTPSDGASATLPPGLSGFRPDSFSTKGRVLDVDDADALSFGYTLLSYGIDLIAWRVTLPIVREDDFLLGNARLLNVKLRHPSYEVQGAVFRNTLRIYALDDTAGRRFDIRVYVPANGAVLVAEAPVITESREGSDATFPYFAEVNLNELFNRDFCFPFSAHSPCVDLDFMVEVVPATPAPYYAFLTLTNEKSQQVTVITPQ